jgi:hypothetical protein
MVDQDPPVVVDDQELEPAREHGLALGEQHFPAERHDIAPLARTWGGAKANALAGRVLCRGYKGEPPERGVSAPPLWLGAFGAQSAAMAEERLAASGSFHAST